MILDLYKTIGRVCINEVMFSDTRAHKGTLYAMYNIFMWALKYAASFISYDNMYMYIQYLTCQIIHK